MECRAESGSSETSDPKKQLDLTRKKKHFRYPTPGGPRRPLRVPGAQDSSGTSIGSDFLQKYRVGIEKNQKKSTKEQNRDSQTPQTLKNIGTVKKKSFFLVGVWATPCDPWASRGLLGTLRDHIQAILSSGKSEKAKKHHKQAVSSRISPQTSPEAHQALGAP